MNPRSTTACLFTAAAVFAVLLTVWRLARPTMNPRAEHPNQTDSTSLWLAPDRLPLTVVGDLSTARTVVIGDSRAMNGVRRDLLDGAGLGPSCVVWRGAADLMDLMSVIDTDRVELLIVALSPLSVSPYENKIMQEICRSRAPVFEAGEHSAARIFEWVREERQHLLGEDFPAASIDPTLAMLQRSYKSDAAAMTFPGKVDLTLARGLRDLRFDLCMPLKTGLWNRSWLPLKKPRRSNGTYRKQLSSERYRTTFDVSADAIARRMGELSQGVELIAVRIPIDPILRGIENRAVAPIRIAQIASKAKVTFVDFGTSPHTNDGSHLNAVGSVAWTEELIAELSD